MENETCDEHTWAMLLKNVYNTALEVIIQISKLPTQLCTLQQI